MDQPKNKCRHSSSGDRDMGPQPFVTNLDCDTVRNKNYRTTVWTGRHLQLTLMSIPANDDIGLEVHPHVDQILKIVEGIGQAMMGPSKHNLDFRQDVRSGSAVFIPAGTWHNLKNTGRIPLKVYSIYAPPNHPHGTVHPTKAIAEAQGD